MHKLRKKQTKGTRPDLGALGRAAGAALVEGAAAAAGAAGGHGGGPRRGGRALPRTATSQAARRCPALRSIRPHGRLRAFSLYVEFCTSIPRDP